MTSYDLHVSALAIVALGELFGCASKVVVSTGGPAVCDPGDIECAGACCHGACNAGVCTSITTVSDCPRLTPLAKPIAIIDIDAPNIDADYSNIAVAAGYVYYISQGSVRRAPTSGGPPEVVSTRPIDLMNSALVANADVAFYQGIDGVDRASVGSPSTLIAAGSPSFVDQLALTSSDLIVGSTTTEAGPVSFYRVPQAGGALTLFNQGPAGIGALTTYGDAAYFVSLGGVFTLPIDGSAPKYLGSLVSQLGKIAADEDTIFATRFDPMSSSYGFIASLDITTGTSSDILPGLVLNWAVDDDAIFGIGGFSLNGTFVPSIFKMGKHQVPTTQSPPTLITSSDLELTGSSSYSYGSTALAIDSESIYFIERCTDNLPQARLVSVSKDFTTPNP